MSPGEVNSIRFPEKWSTTSPDATRTDIVTLVVNFGSLSVLTIYDHSVKQFVRTYDLKVLIIINQGPRRNDMSFNLMDVTSTDHSNTAAISEYNIYWIVGDGRSFFRLFEINIGTNLHR